MIISCILNTKWIYFYKVTWLLTEPSKKVHPFQHSYRFLQPVFIPRQFLFHLSGSHYENMPIQIYWKFYHQKMKFWYFSYFCSKHRLWVPVRTASMAVLTSTHNLCFWAEIRKVMYTPVNPSFTILGQKSFGPSTILILCSIIWHSKHKNINNSCSRILFLSRN